MKLYIYVTIIFFTITSYSKPLIERSLDETIELYKSMKSSKGFKSGLFMMICEGGKKFDFKSKEITIKQVDTNMECNDFKPYKGCFVVCNNDSRLLSDYNTYKSRTKLKFTYNYTSSGDGDDVLIIIPKAYEKNSTKKQKQMCDSRKIELHDNDFFKSSCI